MKKVLALLCTLSILALSACNNKNQSVDLSNITFDGVSVGDNFDRIETDKYAVSTRYPTSDDTYNYEEWRIVVYNEKVKKITASFEHISISVNGKEDCRSVDDIINVLGEECNSSWYDKEQSLKQIMYSDNENGLQCSFVYDKNSNNLVWGIMQAI